MYSSTGATFGDSTDIKSWVGFWEEGGKQEYPEKNLSEQRREPTYSTQMWHSSTDLVDEWKLLMDKVASFFPEAGSSVLSIGK